MKATAQTSLFAVANESALDELRNADVGSLTGDEAKRLLEETKRRLV
jgi:hypothetical protein